MINIYVPFVADDTPVSSSNGAKLFFFPDENLTTQDRGKPLPQVTTELGDITYRSNKSSDTDEEFCFLGDEAGSGLLVRKAKSAKMHVADNILVRFATCT